MTNATIVDVKPTLFSVWGEPTAYELSEDDLTPVQKLDRRWRRAMTAVRHQVRNWREEREVARIMHALDKLDDSELELLGLDRRTVEDDVERRRGKRIHATLA